MLKQQPKPFSIKCQCSAYRNGLIITSKKKSRFSNLVLNPKTKTIHIIPLNSKDQDYVFQLKRLKHIHKKFISEGKITIEFTQQAEKARETGNLAEGKNMVERLSQIFVQAASPQNLQLLIKKIVELKSSMKNEIKTQPKKQALTEKEHTTQDEGKNPLSKSGIMVNKKKQDYPKLQKFEQNLAERKRDPLKYNQSVKKYQEQENHRISRMSRKQLMKQAYRGEPLEIEYEKVPSVKPIFRPLIDLLSIPHQLLKKVYEYTRIELRLRLINKNFDRFVLRNIKGLNFRDEVDDETFNRLAKYVPNIRGRLKNIRTIELIDLYDEPQLEKNHAKSLYLGQWKEMSKKNIMQIKGLRIHTLQMPYHIKFEFQEIYGIRLRELHLMSKSQVTTVNYMISDENLIYLFKHVRELEAFSIPYINSSVLDELTTNLKEKTLKLRSLRFGSVNENCKKEEKWFLFHAYENLRCLTVERVLKGGLMRKNCNYTFTFPLYIEQLDIGSIVSQQTIKKLPTTLTYLKLQGEQYYNNHIANIFLPYLRCFDISECPLVRPAVISELQKCNKLIIITNWERQDYEYWKQMALEKDIQVISLKGMIRR